MDLPLTTTESQEAAKNGHVIDKQGHVRFMRFPNEKDYEFRDRMLRYHEDHKTRL